jgi:hypothetical protein
MLRGGRNGCPTADARDPYGNFLANQQQLPILIVELEEIGRSTQDLEFKHRISDLVGFLESSKGPHVYVRFVGD